MADSDREGVTIRDCGSMSEVDFEPLAPSDPSNPNKPAQFDFITENIYISQSLQASKDRKRAKRMVCDCQFDPEQDDAQEACGNTCLNRVLLIECGSRCPCGVYCTNKDFQRANYAKVEVFKTEMKGWGLRATQRIPLGNFVMEYCGEVCTISDFERRKEVYSREKRRHYYFMSLRTDQILDATKKGNLSRYINHSCDPNCETQKWTVNGRLCIGFFSVKEIQANEELTFDYQFQRFGDVAQKCYCGADNCRGFLGQTKQAPPITKISNHHSDHTPPQSPSSSASSRRRGKHRTQNDADSAFEKEIYDIIGSSWKLRESYQVVAISRTMLQAETPSQRTMLLQVVQATEDQGCLKKFVSLQGLRLLWSWMIDSADLCTSEVLQFRINLLQTLSHLPVTTKNQIDESKLLPVVSRWADNSRRMDHAHTANDRLDTPSTPSEGRPTAEPVDDSRDAGRIKTEAPITGADNTDVDVDTLTDDATPTRGVVCSSAGVEATSGGYSILSRTVTDMAEDISEGELSCMGEGGDTVDVSEPEDESAGRTDGVVNLEARPTDTLDRAAAIPMEESESIVTPIEVGVAPQTTCESSRCDTGADLDVGSEGLARGGEPAAETDTSLLVSDRVGEGGVSSPEDRFTRLEALEEDPVPSYTGDSRQQHQVADLVAKEAADQVGQELADHVAKEMAAEMEDKVAEEMEDKMAVEVSDKMAAEMEEEMAQEPEEEIAGEVKLGVTDDMSNIAEVTTGRTNEAGSSQDPVTLESLVSTDKAWSADNITEQSTTQEEKVSAANVETEDLAASEVRLCGDDTIPKESMAIEESNITQEPMIVEGTVDIAGQEEQHEVTRTSTALNDAGFNENATQGECKLPGQSMTPEGTFSTESTDCQGVRVAEGLKFPVNSSTAQCRINPQVPDKTEESAASVSTSLVGKPPLITYNTLSKDDTQELDDNVAAMETESTANTAETGERSSSDPLKLDKKEVATSMAASGEDQESETDVGNRCEYRDRLVGVLKKSASLSDISLSSVPEVALTVEGADESSMNSITVAASQACEDICNPSSIMKGSKLRHAIVADSLTGLHRLAVETDSNGSSQSDTDGLTPPRQPDPAGKTSEENVGIASETSSWSMQSDMGSSTNIMRSLMASNRNTSGVAPSLKFDSEYLSDSSQSTSSIYASDTLGPSSLHLSLSQNPELDKQFHDKEREESDLKGSILLARNHKSLVGSDSVSSVSSSDWSRGASSYKESDGSLVVKPRGRGVACDDDSGERGVIESPLSSEVEESEEPMDETEDSDTTPWKEDFVCTRTKLSTISPLLKETTKDVVGITSDVNEEVGVAGGEVLNDQEAMESQEVLEEHLDVGQEVADSKLAQNSGTEDHNLEQKEEDNSKLVDAMELKPEEGGAMDPNRVIESGCKECESAEGVSNNEYDDGCKEALIVCDDRVITDVDVKDTKEYRVNFGDNLADCTAEVRQTLNESEGKNSEKMVCEISKEMKEEKSREPGEVDSPVESGLISKEEVLHKDEKMESVELVSKQEAVLFLKKEEGIKQEETGVASEGDPVCSEQIKALGVDSLKESIPQDKGVCAAVDGDTEDKEAMAANETGEVEAKNSDAMETEVEDIRTMKLKPHTIENEEAVAHKVPEPLTGVTVGTVEVDNENIERDIQESISSITPVPLVLSRVSEKGELSNEKDDNSSGTEGTMDMSLVTSDVPESKGTDEELEPRKELSEKMECSEDVITHSPDVAINKVEEIKPSCASVSEKPTVNEDVPLSVAVETATDNLATGELEIDLPGVNEECGNESEAGTGSSTEGEGEGGERKGDMVVEMSEECKALQLQVEEAARQLLAKWSGLKEVFRIPKKASKPARSRFSPPFRSPEYRGHSSRGEGGRDRSSTHGDYRDDDAVPRRRGHNRSRWEPGDGHHNYHHHHSYHHHNQHHFSHHSRYRDRERSPVRKSGSHSSSNHFQSPLHGQQSLLSANHTLPAASQAAPTSAYFPGSSVRQHSPFMQQQMSHRNGPHHQNTNLSPGQGGLRHSMAHPGPTPLLAIKPMVPGHQMQQSPRGVGDHGNYQQQNPSGHAQNIRASSMHQTQLRVGQQQQQQVPSHAHNVGLGQAQQMGSSHSHQQGLGHAHQLGSGHTQQVVGHTLQGIGRALQTSTNTLQQQQQQQSQQQHHFPGNQFQPSALSAAIIPGSNQMTSPVGHSPNQNRPQLPAALQSQLQQQQTGQSQQILGGANTLNQRSQMQALQPHLVGSQFPSGQQQEQNRHQSPGGLIQSQLLQVQQLAAQRSQLGASLMSQAHFAAAMGNRPSVSPAQTQLASAQRVLMQPSVQGTTLQATQQAIKSSVVGGAQQALQQQLPVVGGAQQALQQQPSVVGGAQQALQQQPSIMGGTQQSLQQQPSVVGGAQHSLQQQAALSGSSLAQNQPVQTSQPSVPQSSLLPTSRQGLLPHPQNVSRFHGANNFSPSGSSKGLLPLNFPGNLATSMAGLPLNLPGNSAPSLSGMVSSLPVVYTSSSGVQNMGVTGQNVGMAGQNMGVVGQNVGVAGALVYSQQQQQLMGGSVSQVVVQTPQNVVVQVGGAVQGQAAGSVQSRLGGVTSNTLIAPPPSENQAIPTLPPNWKMAKDPKGKPYYYHVITRETQWEVPVALDEGTVGMDLGTPEPELVLDSKPERVGPRTPTELEETPHTPLVSEIGPHTPPGNPTPPGDTALGSCDSTRSHRSKERRAKRLRSRSPRPRTPVESPPISKRPKSSDDEDDIFRNTPISSPVNPANAPRTTIFDLNTPPLSSTFSNKSPSPHPRTPPFSPPTSQTTPPSNRKHHTSNFNHSLDTPPSKRKIAKKEEQQKEMFRHQVSKVVTSCLDYHRKSDCKYGRITCAEDFKYLARKLTYGLTEKEASRKKFGKLEFTDSVKAKVKEYIRQYMKKTGPVYKRHYSNSP